MVKNNKDNDDSDFEEEIISKKEYQKLLSSIFPSKYMSEKVKKNSKSSSKKKKASKSKRTVTKDSKRRRKKAESSDSESEDSDDDEMEEGAGQTIDLVFTILPKGATEEDDELIEDDSDDSDEESEEEEESDESDEDDEEDEEEEEEEDDEEDDSDYEPSENTSEEEEEDEEEEEEEDDEEEEGEEKPRKKKLRNKVVKKATIEDAVDDDSESIYSDIQEFSKSIQSKYKKNSAVAKEIKAFEKKIMKERAKVEKKEKRQNTKQYLEKVSSKSISGDVKFFKESLSLKQQKSMLKELDSINKLSTIEKPYRIQLLESDIPNKIKAIALKKINAMKVIASGGGEYSKLKNWVDSFLQIPFNKISTLPVTLNDPPEKIHEFMEKSEKILDDAVYGMNDAKIQLMQMVGQWISNPHSIGNAIALKGPMGTGKTTLIKYGVSKLLNREFAFIPLGGATDSSFLEGHSYTYEGSTYGKIIDILIQCKTSNPVIYFDELDKVSETPKGEEIIGILTHLTDTTQNDKFHDKYFSEIDFDLSKCLFIFSYNDENKINPILKDRMYNIETKGYDHKEKSIISNKYLIPKIEKEINIDSGSITFDDDTLKYIIENFTQEEKGVRNLKRCFEIIYSKINLYRLMRPDSKLFDEEVIQNIQFPYQINKEIVDKLIKKKEKDRNISAMNMYL